MAKTLEKIFKQNFCQKCSEWWDLSVEFFWGYACFEPIQNGQNTWKNYQTKFLSKMLRMSWFISRIVWGYACFRPIQNGQNTCKNFQTKFLSKMLRMLRFISRTFLRLRMFLAHTKRPKHLKKLSNKIFVKNAQDVMIYQ